MPCMGCLACKQTGSCVINDDMGLIGKSMSEADFFIFGSPVHFTNVSSLYLNFIERSLIPLHTFEYLGKPFITVVTTNGSGEQEVDKFLTKIGLLYGGIKVGSILKSDNDEFKAKAYNRLVLKTILVMTSNSVRPRFMNKIYFSSMKNIIKKNENYFKAEIEIWRNKGWLNKNYNDIYSGLYRDK